MLEEITINWTALGAKLAVMSDEEQSDFFRGFINEIDSWDTHYKKEMQLVSIACKLTDKEKELLSTISYKECKP